MKKTLIISLLAITAFASCKKDEEKTTTTPGPTLTKTQMITAKNWKLTGGTIGGVDFFSQMDACDKDDLFIFKTDGSFINDNGATKCDPSDDQIIATDTWKFIDNETKLYFDGDTGTLSELTSSKFVVKATFGGAEVVSTFTAQ